jgi:O-palmitoleoyl-L-serine hydrolase
VKQFMFLFVMVVALHAYVSVDAAPLMKITITDAINKLAVCNDGTPGVYYLRNGFGSGAKRWVILLQGGFPCDVSEGCNGTSHGTPPTITYNVGLLSDNATYNPDFYNANTVEVPQCSSDLWSGNRFEPSGSHPQFRGRNIFQNVIAELMAKSGNNLLSPGTEILLAGASSGGIGVMVHLDWLAGKLPQAKVRGLNDGGWIPEKSTKSNVRNFEEGIAKGMLLWNGKPDVDCMRANPARKSKCYLSGAYPYVTTPLFIAESQWDWIFVLNPADPTADEFARAVRDSLVPVQAAWSPRVVTHVMSTRGGFSTQKIGTVTFKDLLGNWFFERAGKLKAVEK